MHDEGLREIESEIARLKAAVAALEARVHDGTEPVAAVDLGSPVDPVDPPPQVDDGRTDRRGLLRKAAGGAAAAVVGGAALAIGQASPAAAASGSFDGNPAVSATSTGAASTAVRAVGGNSEGGFGVNADGRIGVQGTGHGSWGVYGQGQSGVAGVANGGAGTWGVSGTSQQGFGVGAFTDTGVALQAATLAEGMHLRLGGGTNPPLTSTKPWLLGDMARDTNGDLWLCVQGGTPGQWRRVAGPTTAGSLVSLPAPARVYDSRPGFPPATTPKNPLQAGTARTIDLKANGSGVPAGAQAVLVSLVATGTTTGAGGFMAIFRNGVPWPGTSNLNWSAAGATVAVTTLTSVDNQARANLYAGSVTDVVVDVLGYYM